VDLKRGNDELVTEGMGRFLFGNICHHLLETGGGKAY